MSFEKQKKTLDISTDPLDLRFTLSLSDQTIREQGRSLISTDNQTCNEDWLQNLDRKKLVSFSISCFKRILDSLDVSDEDVRHIMKIRNIENKRVSTKYNRRKIAMLEIQRLKSDRMHLVQTKQKLQHEIEFYTKCLLQNQNCEKKIPGFYEAQPYNWNLINPF